MKFFLVALWLVEYFECLKIEINDAKVFDFDLSSPVLIFPDEKIRPEIVNLKVLKYEKDEEILKINNILQLETVYLNNTGQTIMTRFENVPKLKQINFRNNNIEIIMSHFFAHTTTTHIELQNNNIRYIEEYSFGDHVNYLDLECNKLKEFNPNWLKNPNQLIIIGLSGNYIENIRGNTFQNFTNLNQVYLALNRIKTIEPKAFSSRNYFHVLYLAYNNLTDLNPNIFKDGKIVIYSLDIRHNNISFFSKLLVNKLTLINAPFLDGNPFQCPCYLEYIHNWINWENSDLWNYKDEPNEPRCVTSPGPLQNTCVETIDYNTINHYRKNRTPTKNDRNKYCSCIKETHWGYCLKLRNN